MTAKAAAGHFDSRLFRFLQELKANNNREWFTARKERFAAEVEEPMRRFIGDFQAKLERISRHFLADPRRVGGSMFRIHRDTRFSKDKTPYKCAIGAHFAHRQRGRDGSVTGFYLHLEPGTCLAGGGIYHPGTAALKRIRDRIAAKPLQWESVLGNGVRVEGETLKRVPAGYDPEHRFAADLKRKDHYQMVSFSEGEVCSPGFLDRYAETCQATAPLVEFLTRALGHPW